MVIALVVLLIIVVLVVASFLLYGMFLGIARLGGLIVRGYSWLIAQEEISEERVRPSTGTIKTVHDQGIIPARNCWEIKGCSLKTRSNCPAYHNPGIPCWKAWMLVDKQQRVKPDCLACTLFSIPSLLGKA